MQGLTIFECRAPTLRRGLHRSDGVMKRFAVVCVLLGCVLPAPYARAGGPAMLIGVAEDNVRQPTLAEAKVEMDLLVRAGFNAVRVTQIWAPGETTPSAAAQRILRNVVQAARLDGV